MLSHLRPLPILERWDCHYCTACCRETTIQLNDEDLAKLQSQRWGEQREFRGVNIIGRSAWLVGPPVLAHKEDGSCVFLTDAGRCRIHEEFGADAKPLMCRQFPLMVVRTDRETIATVLRSCPSAAADRGRPLSEHLTFLRELIGDGSADSRNVSAPPMMRRTTRSWDDFYRMAEAVRQLLVDDRVPLVRRLVHCLRFCDSLEQVKWKRVGPDAVSELVEMLEQAASDDVGKLFQDRQPPSTSTARLFRRLGAHFIRCYPGGRPTRTLLDHWRVLRFSGRMARSSGVLPELHPQFSSIDSAELERPLGPLSSEVLHPLIRFYESHAVSKRYALAQPARSLVDSVRRLAFTFPMAMWMLRWRAVNREPAADDMAQIVVALERGFVLPALSRAAGYLAESGELERLIAWYGR